MLMLALTSCGISDTGCELEYTLLDDGTYEVTSVKGDGKCTEITVPAEVGGIKVTAIGANAFSSKTDLTRIVLPAGITHIGNGAFSGCSSLTQLDMPDSLVSVGIDAFSGCHSLIELTAQTPAVNYVDGWIVSAHNVTGEVVVNDGTVGISDYAFNTCEISSVVLPDSLKYIGNCAFGDSQSKNDTLRRVDFGCGIVSIGYHAFYGCEKLGEVHIAEGTPWHTVKICDFGSPFIYAETVTLGDEPLKEIVIPDGVVEIPSNVFSHLSTLESITIPDSVVKIGAGAFENTSKLGRIYIDSLEQWCKIDFEDKFSNPLGDNLLYVNGESVHTVKIPDKITEIKPYAFYNAKTLVSVDVGDGVTEIGNYAFAECKNLEHVNMGSVKHIGDYAFTSTALTSIVIPDTVEYIGTWAFNYCTQAESVVIGAAVKLIGQWAFCNLNSVNAIAFKDKDGWFVTENPDATSGTPIDIDEEGAYLVITPNVHNSDNPYLDFYWKKN